MKRYIIAIAAGASLFTACKKGTEEECPVGLVCTMELRSISVAVRQGGMPVALDSFRTVRLGDNKVYDMQAQPGSWTDSATRASGNYTVASDGMLSATTRSGRPFEFRGYKNGVLIVQEQYTINHDCCHINKVAGPAVVNL